MSKYIGFVKKIKVKTGEGKRGPWSLYSFMLEKKDGSEYEDWITAGFKAPSFKEGDFISLEASKDDRGYLKVVDGTVKVSAEPPVRAKPVEKQEEHASSSVAYSRATNPEDAKRMSYANARTAALELTKLLLENDALPHTAAQTKAGEAKRFDEISAAVDKLTVRFYNDGITLRLLETVADTVVSKSADGPLPDQDESEAEEEEQDEEEDFE